MKKFKYLSMALALMLAASSCNDDEPTPTPIDDGDISQELPTTDQLSQRVNDPVMVMGNIAGEDLAVALKNRATTTDVLSMNHDEGAATVVIACNTAGKLTPKAYEDLVLHFLGGKNIVVVAPTKNGWNSLAEGMADAYRSLLDRLEIPLGHDESAEDALEKIVLDADRHADGAYGLPMARVKNLGANDKFACIVALRSNDVRCFYDDMQPDGVLVSEEEYSRESEDAEQTLVSSTPDTRVNDVVIDPNGYQTGLMADLLAAWLNEWNKPTDNALKVRMNVNPNAAEQELKDLMTAQPYSEYMHATNSTASKEYIQRSCPVYISYLVWSVYDFDKDVDYYVINQTITAHNGDLNCTSGKKDWDYDDKAFTNRKRYLGAWAGDVTSHVELVDTNGAHVVGTDICQNILPQTLQEQATFSKSRSFNLGANLGLSSNGLQGGFTGGVTFTDNYSISVPDYSVEMKSEFNGSGIDWKYKAGRSHIKGHSAFLAKDYYHDIVPGCYRNNCDFNHSWIYKVDHPKGQYRIQGVMSQQLVWYMGNKSFGMHDHYTTQTTEKSYWFDLNVPSRYKTDWYMNVRVPAGIDQEKVRNFMAGRYGAYWKEAFTSYEKSADSTMGIDQMMNDLKQRIKADSGSWSSAGFKGEFTIEIHPSDSPAVHKMFTFTIN